MQALSAASWYGKLPSAGDFVSRRLGPGFIEPWDRWLAGGLAAWREADPQWLRAYLAGPTWRFLLAADAFASRSPALAGVLMPSVDSVGRYFPLTLVLPLVPLPAKPPAWHALLNWLHRLEDTAVDALQSDWTVMQFEAALAELALPTPAAETAASLPDWALPLATAAAGSRAARGRSWWWRDDAAGTPRLFELAGLPTPPVFARLLSGDPTKPTAFL